MKQEHLSGLGKSLGHLGWISQYLTRFDGARIQCSMIFTKILSLNIIIKFDNKKISRQWTYLNVALIILADEQIVGRPGG